MKIFITGANGQLAKTIAEIYPQKDLFFGTRENLDITDKKIVDKQIKAFKPDIIFHFASLTRGDECALHPDKAYDINVNGTKYVAEAAAEIDAAVLLVSTNEVFDGKKKTPYHEDDKPNPITIVGKTKLEAEKIIKEKVKKHFIVRTSWLYSKWNSNFIHAVLNKAIKDKKIELVKDEVSTPTYSLDLVEGIKKLIETDKYGTYHLSNAGISSRLEFAKKAFDIKNLKNVEITPVALADYKRASKPPLFTPLENRKAKKLGIELPQWDDALIRFLAIN